MVCGCNSCWAPCLEVSPLQCAVRQTLQQWLLSLRLLLLLTCRLEASAYIIWLAAGLLQALLMGAVVLLLLQQQVAVVQVLAAAAAVAAGRSCW